MSSANPTPDAVLAERIDVLRRVPFLKGLDDATLARLATRASHRNFTRGEPLCHDGQHCRGVWIVKDGSIQSVKTSAAGRLRVLETVGCGGTCSMLSTLDGSECPVRTEARTDSTALFLGQADVVRALEATPGAGMALARFLATRLRRVTCELASLSLQDVRSRVAAFLLKEAAERGEASDGRATFRLCGSQEEIAHRLGTEREVFARTLRGFRTERFIDQVRDRVSILDMSGLGQVANPRDSTRSL